MKKRDDNQTGKFNLMENFFRKFFHIDKNPRPPVNLVVLIPRIFCVLLLIALIWGFAHVYGNGRKAFNGTLEQEQRGVTKIVSVNGEEDISQKRFLKTIWAREPQKKFLLWESLPGLYAGIKKDPINKKYEDLEILSCEEKVAKGWSDDKTKKVNAWCSLIGIKKEALGARGYIRRIVNKNDAIPARDENNNIKCDENDQPIYVFKDAGNKELFELPEYSFWEGIKPFPDTKISKNGEYTLSIYPSVQEGMSKFMSDNNMIGVVFAYRPSNGDIYCMASTPGWTEREEIPGQANIPRSQRKTRPKKGSEMNKNFYSFTPGSTMKPISLLLLKVQGKDLQRRIQIPRDDHSDPLYNQRDKQWSKTKDSYFVKVDMKEDGSGPKTDPNIEAVHCTGARLSYP